MSAEVNFFELFQLPIQFQIDAKQLEAAYKDVQTRVHPDRFAVASDAERRVAMQWAATANEAFQTLKKPLSRAQYLLKLNGVDVGLESNTKMPMDFLMQQMEWRESLESAVAAKSMSDLDGLNDLVGQENRALILALQEALADQSSLANAAVIVRKLHFIQKLDEEISSSFDLLAE